MLSADGEPQTGDGCDGIGSDSGWAERQARTEVLQACVASGNLIRVLIACFVLRRMPCGPGASHASVGLTALEESVCPAEVWSLLVLDLRRRGDALWLLYVMCRISNDLLWLAFSYCVLLVV